MIVAAAIRFFADEGFEGQVRELASRIGVKHSVLFRHFASKEALIERVYEEVYLSRWRPEWERALRDRTRSLEDRLLAFYQAYTAAIFTYDWIRIFLFAGLKGVLINARYLDLIRDHVLVPICMELRRDAGLPDAEHHPITAAELELVWGLHGKVFYLAIRAFVYRMPVPLDEAGLIRDAVQVFLKGIRSDDIVADDPAQNGSGSHDSAAPRPIGTSGPRGLPPRASAKGRRRMRPDEREEAIVAEAIQFFAEHGMDGHIRGLANRLGVTHPLLYRYFPTKDALVERVYEAVYLKRWDPAWDGLLLDPRCGLRERVGRFYAAYADVVDRYEWIRIFLYSGLRDVGITTPYLDLVRARVIEPIAEALHRTCAIPPDRATEMVWGLHGQILYIAIRRWVYRVPVALPTETIVAAVVTDFFDGAAAALRRLVADGGAPDGCGPAQGRENL